MYKHVAGKSLEGNLSGVVVKRQRIFLVFVTTSDAIGFLRAVLYHSTTLSLVTFMCGSGLDRCVISQLPYYSNTRIVAAPGALQKK